MTRKFKTEPVSAEDLVEAVSRLHDCRGWHPHRAARLLTNWALWGHNPARNVTTCRECKGKGGHWGWHRGPRGLEYTLIPCPSCNGTGKAVKL